jgi:hypothetical protein
VVPGTLGPEAGEALVVVAEDIGPTARDADDGGEHRFVVGAGGMAGFV